MAFRKGTKDIDVTKEEFSKLQEAFKKDEFRKLFKDYVDEVSDPENKALYEKEVKQFEKERGIDVTFIHPSPGFVIKTSVDGRKKAFINVASNNLVGLPEFEKTVKKGLEGTEWKLPYIQTQPRDDLDKSRQLCLVYDVIFHPKTLDMATKNPKFKQFLIDTALTSVEDNFNVKLDRKNIMFPRMSYKGSKSACILRKKNTNFGNHSGTSSECDGDIMQQLFTLNPYPYSEPCNDVQVTQPRPSYCEDNLFCTPTYSIVQRKDVDIQECTDSRLAKINTTIPNSLIIEVSLPLLNSMSDVEITFKDKMFYLKSDSLAKYKLEVSLPYYVIECESTGTFDTDKRILTVFAKVDLKKYSALREDSGVESDPSQGIHSSSDDDINVGSPSEEACDSGVITTEKDEFLQSNLIYHLPFHRIDYAEHTNYLSARLFVSNVEPNSVNHHLIENDTGYQVKFFSLGDGCYPVQYSFYLHLPEVILDVSTFKIEIYDDSVYIQISLLKKIETEMINYYVGTSALTAKECSLNLLDKTEIIPAGENSRSSSIENVSCKFSKLKLIHVDDDNSDDCGEEEEAEKETKCRTSVTQGAVLDCGDDCGEPGETTDDCCSIPLPRAAKTRTMSESSTRPCFSARRSILKVSRSLSESNTDTYSSYSTSMESESCTVTKKHVHFNDTIYKQVFRANSSILGQRKKNQRRTRNKKRALERRTSESSGLSDSDMSGSVSEVSDVSETSESSDDGNIVQLTVPSTPGRKNHRRRGKKNHRKNANTEKLMAPLSSE